MVLIQKIIDLLDQGTLVALVMAEFVIILILITLLVFIAICFRRMSKEREELFAKVAWGLGKNLKLLNKLPEVPLEGEALAARSKNNAIKAVNRTASRDGC